jgi:hypothetical protein
MIQNPPSIINIISEFPDNITNDLVIFENKNNIKLFKKRNNNWILRDTRKIINDCNKVKKNKILNLSNDLKNISYKKNIELNKIKEIQEKTNSEIDEIDNIINIISNDQYNKYIEIYSN